MIFGDRLKNLREEKGWNQKELSQISKVSQATISRIESGFIKELRTEALTRLAKALDVTVDYLVGKSVSESSSGFVVHDQKAQTLLRGYEKLSENRKEQVHDFLEFLEKKNRDNNVQ